MRELRLTIVCAPGGCRDASNSAALIYRQNNTRYIGIQQFVLAATGWWGTN
jgi:hypothetical protein